MEEAADCSVDIVAVRVRVLWPSLLVSNPAPSKAVRDSWRVAVTERRCSGQSPAGPVGLQGTSDGVLQLDPDTGRSVRCGRWLRRGSRSNFTEVVLQTPENGWS